MAKSKVARAALKGLGKAFLKRRATIGGVRAGAALKVSKAPSVSTFRGRREVLRGVKAPEKPGYKTGVATGVAATLAALKVKKGKEAKAKEKKEKLEKSAKHHYEKSKKKSKKRGE
jgi:hypothetical protein